MIYLGFLIHIYQPPGQLPYVLDQIISECYRPLFDLINSRKDAFFTLNLNWSLTEKLLQEDYQDVINSIKTALNNKFLEITGTAAYHPILPLIPEKEQLRQIILNYKHNKQVFGHLYQPKGFFLPEMAFSKKIVKVIKNLDYQWTITEDIPFSCIHKETPFNYIPMVNPVRCLPRKKPKVLQSLLSNKVNELPIFLRSSLWSNRISFGKNNNGRNFSGLCLAKWLIKDFKNYLEKKDGYLIIALDGETFGHHIKGFVDYFLKGFLDTLANSKKEIRLTHISNLLDIFPRVAKTIPPGTWATSKDDFLKDNFYPLWKDKYNKAHRLLWQLTNLALKSINPVRCLSHKRPKVLRELLSNGADKIDKEARNNLDKGLNSCTFWWCAIEPKKLSPMTLYGINQLIKVIEVTNPLYLEKALKIKEKLINPVRKAYG